MQRREILACNSHPLSIIHLEDENPLIWHPFSLSFHHTRSRPFLFFTFFSYENVYQMANESQEIFDSPFLFSLHLVTINVKYNSFRFKEIRFHCFVLDLRLKLLLKSYLKQIYLPKLYNDFIYLIWKPSFDPKENKSRLSPTHDNSTGFRVFVHQSVQWRSS